MSKFNYPVAGGITVIDGDTIKAQIDLGFKLFYNADVRLSGVDAPELSDPRQNPAALHVRNLVEAWLATRFVGGELRLLSAEWDKYGRVVGEFYTPTEQLTNYLLQNKLVHIYNGHGLKPAWLDEELSAILAFQG